MSHKHDRYTFKATERGSGNIKLVATYNGSENVLLMSQDEATALRDVLNEKLLPDHSLETRVRRIEETLLDLKQEVSPCELQYKPSWFAGNFASSFFKEPVRKKYE